MLRIAALTLLAVALLPVAAPIGTAVAESPCDSYLAARERLAPLEATCRASLKDILGSGKADTVELLGEISGRASSVESAEGLPAHMLMMTLDDGSHVTLLAGAESEGLRVGERVVIIASPAGAGRSADLVIEAWLREWDLPVAEAETDIEQLVEPVAADATEEGGGESILEIPQTLVQPRDLPRSAATMAFRADAVQAWKAYVLDHNSNLTDAQAEDIVTWVLYYSQQHNVNHKLIFSLIKWESWFKPGNISRAGAIGLMQVMPGTARGLGIDPHNVQQNIEGGIRYLAAQLAKYPDRPNHERVILALACYNAGPNAVRRAGHRVPNITETRNYVRKVTETFRELHESDMP